jgi:hypothetical protein
VRLHFRWVPIALGYCLDAFTQCIARAFGSCAVVGIVPSMNRGEKVFDDEIRYVAAQPLAGGEVRAEMHAGENPA